MNCSKCGKPIQEDAVYCPYCGKKLVSEPRKHPKRANGLGSVYYDARSKRWIAQWVTGRKYSGTGLQTKISFSYKRKSFQSRTAALKHVQKMEEEAAARPEFTVSYYYTAMKAARIDKLSKDKQTAYRIAYDRIKKIHGKAVKDLTLPEMQEIVDSECSTYYPAHDIRTLLNGVFKRAAQDDRQINVNLPHLIELPPLEEEEVDPYTEEEQLMLWYSYEAGNEDAAIPLIMIYTGMMTGEMRKLTKDMIDLERREIGNSVGLKTKERKKRVVLIPDDIVPVLEDVIAKAPENHLFPTKDDNFYNHYYKALEVAGITRHLTPYSCRHTTATVLAVHENVAPQVLQRVMRWKSTKMADRYVTPTEKDARKAINRI